MKHTHCELIKAWAEGVKIEYKTTKGDWEIIENPGWVPHVEYRVKSKKKYIPYTIEDYEYCINNLLGQKVRQKGYHIILIITSISKRDKTLYIDGVNSYIFFNTYTLMNGTPTGKIEG